MPEAVLGPEERAARERPHRQGHIGWEDRRHLPGALSPTKKGQATKWRLSKALMEAIEAAKSGAGKAVVIEEEQGGQTEELVPDGLVLQVGEGKEDLGYDRTFFMEGVEAVPDWLIDFRPPRFIRPVLDLGYGGLREAA